MDWRTAAGDVELDMRVRDSPRGGVGWGGPSTAERELLGKESRDQGVIPEEFLCERGRLQKYPWHSWALPLGF